MFVLSVDTCASRGSLAALDGSEVRWCVRHSGNEPYSSWLFNQIAGFERENPPGIERIDLFAVTCGPGSFTGLRVGLTAVKGWSEVYGKPIAAVSRLEALAWSARADSPFLLSFVDAQRSQLFGALYERNGPQLRRLTEEAVVSPEGFLDMAKEFCDPGEGCLVSPDLGIFSRSSVARLAAAFRQEEVSPFLAPAIGLLGAKHALAGNLTDACGLDANYVRRSDAEIFWKGPASHVRRS